jgi:hypothetical protein
VECICVSELKDYAQPSILRFNEIERAQLMFQIADIERIAGTKTGTGSYRRTDPGTPLQRCGL